MKDEELLEWITKRVNDLKGDTNPNALAHKAGVARKTVEGLLNGEHATYGIGIVNLIRIIRACEVEPWEFFMPLRDHDARGVSQADADRLDYARAILTSDDEYAKAGLRHALESAWFLHKTARHR